MTFTHDPYSHVPSTQVIAAKETGTQAPVKRIENCSFLYTRHLNMYFVAITRSNVNPALVFEYLFQKIAILKAYLGEEFDENSMRNNMTLIYELMDETMDFGYPQNCAVDVLRLYINLGNVRPQDEPEPSQLTNQITGAIDWRREGIKHKRNEVYIDVLESVNLLLSSTGSVLRNEVTGQVQMNTKLTGMPECKFGLNDKLVIDREETGQRKPGVEIDDCTFHRCVRLGKFDADRTITFIPPDGEFELMRYRVTDNINVPFRFIPAVQEEHGHTRYESPCFVERQGIVTWSNPFPPTEFLLTSRSLRISLISCLLRTSSSRFQCLRTLLKQRLRLFLVVPNMSLNSKRLFGVSSVSQVRPSATLTRKWTSCRLCDLNHGSDLLLVLSFKFLCLLRVVCMFGSYESTTSLATTPSDGFDT